MAASTRDGDDLCGFLTVLKPSGPTSHDIVARVRRFLRTKSVGHAGTLDPMASGVLLLGVGPATRLLQYAAEGAKEYVARLRLGLTTDTEDVTGKTIEERSTTAVTREALERVCAGMLGPQLQTPPMYSALRQGGKRLYELARQGQTVERTPRPVSVFDLEVLEFGEGDAAEATLRISCSGGFYVRSLCRGIGEALGCGGCMAELKRTAVGRFHIEDARSLEEIETAGAEAILPPSAALQHLPALQLPDELVERAGHGNHVVLEQSALESADEAPVFASNDIVRLEDTGGKLVALARTLEMSNGSIRCQPFLVLNG